MERRESYLAYLYESAWILPSVAIPVGMLVALILTAFAIGIHLPGQTATVDPRRLAQTPPFDRPGLREVRPGQYEAVVIGQIWSFTPNEIQVPAGATVTFIATSRDVVHGFRIQGTTVNGMLIPGQVTRLTYRFTQPGEYLLVCHEYCGVGHHGMYGRIRVVAPTP